MKNINKTPANISELYVKEYKIGRRLVLKKILQNDGGIQL